MPELPEVQTIVNDLNEKIKGETVDSFWSDWKRGIRGDLKIFKGGIERKEIISAERIGKNILLKLSGNIAVLIHLRMTGALLLKSLVKGEACHMRQIQKFKEKYTHHIFFFESGKRLEFSDVRKFGSLQLIDIDKKNSWNIMNNLGMDILSERFTSEELDKIVKRSRLNIKQLLMKQGAMAGIGNIYANEILYEAEISPKREAQRLTQKEIKNLYAAIKKIIKKAIKLRGTSISDYRDASGESGKFQKILKVYRRTGQKCEKCGTIIKRSVIGQRSTFYCPRCQK